MEEIKVTELLLHILWKIEAERSGDVSSGVEFLLQAILHLKEASLIFQTRTKEHEQIDLCI